MNRSPSLLLRSPRILAILASVAVASTVAGCSASSEAPETGVTSGAQTEALTACQKADAIWNDHIVPTRYEELPALTAPGLRDLWTMSSSQFTAKSFGNGGDTIEEGRKKLVHTWGAVGRLSLELSPTAAESGFTGLYQEGARCIIGRFSMATKPTRDNSVPALALKFLVDGDAPSVNLHIMSSVDGQNANAYQTGHNFFQETFSNILPEPKSTATKLLAGLFRKGAAAFGAKDPSANVLSVEHLAKVHADGSRVDAPKAPYKLAFVPLDTVNTLMKDATVDDDFRTSLAKIPAGTPLYEVYAADGNYLGTSIGKLVLQSEIIASQYGDENLWFQHNKERDE